jgi:hypothetical protein
MKLSLRFGRVMASRELRKKAECNTIFSPSVVPKGKIFRGRMSGGRVSAAENCNQG